MNDDDLALALELSAADARARSDKPLLLERTGNNSEAGKPRESLGEPLGHHFSARNGRVAKGNIASHGALDQFNSAFGPMIQRHGVAGSICGYVTAANVNLLCARVASSFPPGSKPLCEADVDQLLECVRDPGAVLPEVERNMARVRADRGAYVNAHPEQFGGAAPQRSKAVQDFFRGWLANYELSGLLAGDEAAAAAVAWPRQSVRYNQYPQLSSATPDEAVHIASEEKRFGGKAGAGGAVTFADEDSVFFVEGFSAAAGGRVLQTPQEWVAAESAVNQPPASPVRVFAVDLNGHYSAAVAISNYADGGSRLILINSTDTDYVTAPMMTWLFDTLFVPSAGGGLQVAAPAADAHSAATSAALSDLVDMGFEEGPARSALAQANGSMAVAVDILFAGAS